MVRVVAVTVVRAAVPESVIPAEVMTPPPVTEKFVPAIAFSPILMALVIPAEEASIASTIMFAAVKRMPSVIVPVVLSLISIAAAVVPAAAA